MLFAFLSDPQLWWKLFFGGVGVVATVLFVAAIGAAATGK